MSETKKGLKDNTKPRISYSLVDIPSGIQLTIWVNGHNVGHLLFRKVESEVALAIVSMLTHHYHGVKRK